MKIDQIEKKAKEEIAASNAPEELETVRIKYLGRKGKLTRILHSIGDLPEHERPRVGKKANRLNSELQRIIEQKKKELSRQREIKLDKSLPGRDITHGTLHPLTITTRKIIDIFISMGFSVVRGPEVETEYYNFTALNTPPEHPARDMHDTFYLKNGNLLRTHTSPVQIRTMEKEEPPIRIISPGRCYRVDTFDPTHTPVFIQIEGLWVDRDVSMSDLFGTLNIFAREFFSEDVVTEYSPSYFPFTEPSAEMHIQCKFCKGKGCSICSHTGRIELLGCGMVHPAVLKNLGFEEYTGFAFGMGIDRIAMGEYDIDDIRLFFNNELQFLRQFNESEL